MRNDEEHLPEAGLIGDELRPMLATGGIAGLQGLVLAYGSDGTLGYIWPVRQDPDHPEATWETSNLPPLDFPPEVEDPASSSLLDSPLFDRVADVARRFVYRTFPDEPTGEDFLELGARTEVLWARVAELLNWQAVAEGRDLLIVACPVECSPKEMESGTKAARDARQAALEEETRKKDAT